VKEMPKVERTITINAPVKKVFGYVDDPSHLPEFWPSMFEVKDVKTLPGGGHRFMWFYNFAGKRAQGTTESSEYVPYERIVDMAKGDVEGTITWSFYGENGTTEVKFEADYQAPQKFFPVSEQGFITRRNEFEAETLLANLKAKLEV
jgi:uncharacterized protein YndB with AHSA1/START domain